MLVKQNQVQGHVERVPVTVVATEAQRASCFDAVARPADRSDPASDRASSVGGVLTETSGGNPDRLPASRGGGHWDDFLSVGSECCVGPLPAGSYFGGCGLVVLSDEVGVCGAELIHTPFEMTETFHAYSHSSGGLLAVHPDR